jgi:hypothetical protein
LRLALGVGAERDALHAAGDDETDAIHAWPIVGTGFGTYQQPGFEPTLPA